jgi:hypothetical protein
MKDKLFLKTKKRIRVNDKNESHNTVKVKSLTPHVWFELFISTTQYLFNSIIYPNSRDQVLHLYIYVQNENP